MATINPRNGNSFNSAFVTSQNGTRFQVDAQYQDRFQGLVNDLDARGYQFSQSGGAGGFADRTTASGGTSAHSSGLAIDINPLDNPNAGFKTNLPSDIGDIAAKNGLAWGGADKFGNPDAMHFEVPGAPGSSVKSVGQWNGPEDTAKLSAYNQKSGFSTPLDPNKPMSDGPAPTSKTANSATKGDSAAGVPPKNGQNDITGSAGEFKKQQTQTISSTMPTHEPWDGHPKSGEGPRQAVDGSSGGGSGGSSGAAGGGTATPGSNTAPVTTGGKPTSGTLAQNQMQVYNRLVDKHGFTPDQAAGIVANVTGEGLNGDWTKVTNDVGGPSSGIVQWHDKTYSSGGRYTDYVKYMNSVPGGAASLDNQTDYMANDIKKYDNGAAYKAMQGKDADGTVDAMVRKYEKPANQDAQVAKRQQLLRNFNAMKNKLPKRGDPGMAEGGSSGKPG